MSETAQIILAVSIGILFLCAAGCLAIMAVDMIKGWKVGINVMKRLEEDWKGEKNEQSNRTDD